MSSAIIGVMGVGVLILVMLTGMPIAFVFALVGFAGFGYLVSTDASLDILALDVFETFASYNLTVVPLFVFMGYIAFNSGVSQRLYLAGYKLFGRVRGGLAMGTIVACAAFAACCGSSPASAATMGTVAVPEMRRYKYADSIATGCVAAAGALAILIPPSIVFVIYGIIAEQSIAKLFMAGIIPGIILSLLFIFAIYIVALVKPDLVPAGPPATFKEKLSALVGGTGETVVIFILIMGGLFVGFFTPTEAASIGAAGMLVIATVRRQLTWRGFLTSIEQALKTTAMILLIIAGATIFGHFLAVSKLPFATAGWVSGLHLHPNGIMLIIVMIYIILGCFMDSLAMILLTIPIFFPVARALGFDPIWFGVIIVVVTEMGLITPPVGINVYVIKGIVQDVPIATIFKGIFPFLLCEIILVCILIFFPQTALFLPNMMK